MGAGNNSTIPSINNKVILQSSTNTTANTKYYSSMVPIKQTACNIASENQIPTINMNTSKSPNNTKMRPISSHHLESNRNNNGIKEDYSPMKFKVKSVFKGTTPYARQWNFLNNDQEELHNLFKQRQNYYTRENKSNTIGNQSRHWTFFNTDHALNKPKPAPKLDVIKTQDRPIRFGRYEMLKQLGTGSFATVHLAKDIKTGDFVAMKFIDKINYHGPDTSTIYEEINLMKTINHPNIVKLYDVIETDSVLCIVMEYCENGELYNLIVDNFSLITLNEKKKIFKQLVEAVGYLHRNNICHRDLKVENVLLDKNNNVKLADFNLAKRFQTGVLLTTRCGSEEYTSPEIVTRKAYDPQLTDIWALGVILYALLIGHLPFYHRPNERMQSMYHRIAMVDYRFPPGIEVDKTAKQLLSSILKYTPQSRASIDQILNHPWLKNIRTNNISYQSFSNQYTTYNNGDSPKYNNNSYNNSYSNNNKNLNESERIIPECDNYKFKSVNNYSFQSSDNYKDINGMYTLPRYNLAKF